MNCPICNKPMREQIDGTCISYQETNCICNIAAPKLIWKEMAVLRDKKNIFTQSLRMEKEFAEKECKRLQTELDHTRKELEQSEICCTEWEKQALDYKAENIALSGDLELTRKALEIAVDALKLFDSGQYTPEPDSYGLKTDASRLARKTLEQITAILENKNGNC